MSIIRTSLALVGIGGIGWCAFVAPARLASTFNSIPYPAWHGFGEPWVGTSFLKPDQYAAAVASAERLPTDNMNKARRYGSAAEGLKWTAFALTSIITIVVSTLGLQSQSTPGASLEQHQALRRRSSRLAYLIGAIAGLATVCQGATDRCESLSAQYRKTADDYAVQITGLLRDIDKATTEQDALNALRALQKLGH
ncbi:MAG: hypothetical protein GDA68_20180 [Nitrospira sp. CR2.1]|nr:hypothetical protein [Nitrospira sp. CR2.1]